MQSRIPFQTISIFLIILDEEGSRLKLAQGHRPKLIVDTHRRESLGQLLPNPFTEDDIALNELVILYKNRQSSRSEAPVQTIQEKEPYSATKSSEKELLLYEQPPGFKSRIERPFLVEKKDTIGPTFVRPPLSEEKEKNLGTGIEETDHGNPFVEEDLRLAETVLLYKTKTREKEEQEKRRKEVQRLPRIVR